MMVSECCSADVRCILKSELKKTLLSSEKPVVLKDALLSWKCMPNSLEQLEEHLGHQTLKFRVAKKRDTGSKWEGDADFLEASIKNFLDWSAASSTGNNTEENPFKKYSKTEHWAYSSYNYMNQIFSEENPIMKAIDWSLLGFDGNGAKESVLWIGSPGAYTPCHMDTYGCNLVAQVIGRKQWILFPPDDPLYPTRIPYEESSIFSSVDILNPNLKEFPFYQKCHPHIITLEPGDVLFVPSKWWHFVLNLDVSMSINTWIELDSDDEARSKEAISATLMSVLIPAFNGEQMDWLNPHQDLMKPREAVECVKQCFQRLRKHFMKTVEPENCSSEFYNTFHCPKIPKYNTDKDYKRDTVYNHNVVKVQNVEMFMFSEYIRMCTNICNKNVPELHGVHTDIESIINCFVHPDVISCIFEKLSLLNHDSPK